MVVSSKQDKVGGVGGIYFFAAAGFFFGVFLTAFFAAGFLATFLAAGFFAAAFFADAGFLVATLATAAFFFGVDLVVAFFAEAFFLGAAFFFGVVFLVAAAAGFLATFFFGSTAFLTSLKDPEAPVPLGCKRVPATTLLLRASLMWVSELSETL